MVVYFLCYFFTLEVKISYVKIQDIFILLSSKQSFTTTLLGSLHYLYLPKLPNPSFMPLPIIRAATKGTDIGRRPRCWRMNLTS